MFGVNYAMSPYSTQNLVIKSTGDGVPVVCSSHQFVLEREPTQKEQDYYSKLCDFYFDLDESRAGKFLDEVNREGGEINFKKLYQHLKTRFRCRS